MLDFLFQYGLFLAKALTLVVGILFTVSALIAMAIKAKTKPKEGTLVIYPINEQLNEIREHMQSETLAKHDLKKWHKSQKALEKKERKENKEQHEAAKRLFIIRFEGDMRASEVEELREVVSAILESANPIDEVLVVLESAGGFVHSYGLAASQLDRIRKRKLSLTVSIDKVAASGGYLMACVANRIIAAPFAIVGSIGVVAQLPNFHRLLDKNNIDFEMHTAGEYKRTLTMFGKNTEKARHKFQDEIEETHELFKDFIDHHRPKVDVDEVATGEHWYGIQALDLKLVDAIQTSDDFILAKAKEMKVFEIAYEIKQSLSDKISHGMVLFLERCFMRWMPKAQKTLL